MNNNETFFGAVLRDLSVIGALAGFGATLAAVPVLVLGLLAGSTDAVNAGAAMLVVGSLFGFGFSASLWFITRQEELVPCPAEADY